LAEKRAVFVRWSYASRHDAAYHQLTPSAPRLAVPEGICHAVIVARYIRRDHARLQRRPAQCRYVREAVSSNARFRDGIVVATTERPEDTLKCSSRNVRVFIRQSKVVVMTPKVRKQ